MHKIDESSFSKLKKHLYKQNLLILISGAAILMLCGLLILSLQYVLLREKTNLQTDFAKNVSYIRKQEQLLNQLNSQNARVWSLLNKESRHISQPSPLIRELLDINIAFDWRVPKFIPSKQTLVYQAFTNYLAEFYSNFWLGTVLPAAPLVLFVPNKETNFIIPAQQSFNPQNFVMTDNSRISWQAMPNIPQQAIGIIKAGLNNDLYLGSIFNRQILQTDNRSNYQYWFKVHKKQILGTAFELDLPNNQLQFTLQGIGLCLNDDIYQSCYLIKYQDFLNQNLWLHLSLLILLIIVLIGAFYYWQVWIKRIINNAISNQQSLIHAEHKANQANQAKTQFLTTISHEIRTPLYGVISGLELLENHISAKVSEKEHQKYIDIIKKSAHILLAQLSNLLDLSKIEQGRMQLKLSTFNAQSLADDCIKAFNAIAVVQHTELITEIDPQIPAGLIGDCGKIAQIISNLLSNALKFTKSGVIKLRIKLLDLAAENCLVEFMVSDTGSGIDETTKQQLFKPIISSTGAGLGLAICQQLAQFMDSKITLQSELGAGSAFSFAVNLQHQSHDKHLLIIDEKFTTYLDLGLQILVVEDNPINQFTIKEQLQLLNCKVEITDNPLDALQLPNLANFDLIITDINLPHINGYQFAAKIREKQISTPIIAISANSFIDHTNDLTQNITDFLIKPFSLTDLQIQLAITCELINVIKDDLSTIFVQTMSQDLTKLEQAVNMKDTTQITQLIHRITGALAVTDNHHLVKTGKQLQQHFALSQFEQFSLLLKLLIHRTSKQLENP